MTKTNKKSIRFKINLAIFITCFVTAAMFGAILYPTEMKRLDGHEKNIELLLDTIVKQKYQDLANELFAQQKRALALTLKDFLVVDGIVAASIHTPLGRLYVSTDKTFIIMLQEKQDPSEILKDSFITVSNNGKSYGIFTRRIVVIGQEIGIIKLYYDFAQLANEARQSVIIFSTLLFTTLILLSTLMNIVLSKIVIEPVFKLQKAIRKVQAGHLGETVHLPFQDEIGEMGEAFNEMTVRLQQSQAAIEKAEAEYRSIFENSIEGIFQATPGLGRFLNINPAMVMLLGYRLKTDLLTSVTSIANQLFVDSGDILALESFLQNKDSVLGYETRLYKKDKSIFWASVTARSVYDESGNLMYYEGSLLDVTERRKREKAEMEREAAQAASRSKSAFLANMSHEFRTPLNAILGFTQMMTNDKELSMIHREYLESINHSGEHLLMLINDILDMSKIEAGRTLLEPKDFDLYEMLSTLESMTRFKAEQKSLQFMVERSLNLPRYIMADEKKLRQALLNLLSNAVKFTKKGGIVLTVKQETIKTDASKLCLEFQVTDTGIGIHQDDINDIFKPFVQVSSKHFSNEGTGLGMAICKNFVYLLGGKLRLKSEIGKGSVFSFAIPVTLSTIKNKKQHGGASMQVRGLAPGEPEWRILVVEDDLFNRKLLTNLLVTIGFKVMEANDGAQAIKIHSSFRPHLIWMDMRMPVMDGYEATRQIKKTMEHNTIIIALTAGVFKDNQKQVLASGCDDYVSKPYRKKQIYDTLVKHIGVRFTYDITHSPIAHPSHADLRQKLTHKDLGVLSEDLLKEFKQTIVVASQDGIAATLKKIKRRDRMLADTLEVMIKEFNYEIINELINEALNVK